MVQVHLKYPQRGSRRFYLKVLNTPWRKQKILPKWITHLQSYTTPQGVHFYYSSASFSSPIKSWKRQKIPPHTYLVLSEFSPPLVDPTVKITRAHILRELNMQARWKMWRYRKRKRPRLTRGKSLTRNGRERSEEHKRSESPGEVWGKSPKWTPQRPYPFVVY